MTAVPFSDRLDDILPVSGIVAAPAQPITAATENGERAMAEAVAEAVRITAELYFEQCRKCGGTGRVRWGKCFACDGRGGKHFKTSPETRAANREANAARTARRDAETAAAFAAEFPAESAWMARTAERFEFAKEMQAAVIRFGNLTENQMAAVRRCMARDAERDAARAAARAGTEMDVSGLDAAFATARTNGAVVATLRTPEITFSLAKANSRNPGAIYAKARHGGEYLGKIIGGKFHKSFACTPADAEAVIVASRDPKEAALRYARETDECSICGRLLTDPESKAAGIGPICAAKFGW